MQTAVYTRLSQPRTRNNNRIVSAWLGVGVGMLMVQILLGGITRLTGSGLSITEWDPLMGALPPLNTHAWQQSFAHYQQIAQFKKLNSQFTLADYQSIFFWEWLHREWARLMGLVFLVPFVVLVLQKRISRVMVKPLAILFLLGGLQGAIGWIMVQTGLNNTDTAVNPVALAVHFICALCLLSWLVWMLLQLAVPAHQVVYRPVLRSLNRGLLVLLFVQLIYGALMAGSHAALSAPTWPDINGAFIPDGLFGGADWGRKLYTNPLVIQVVHRSLAYLIGLGTLLWFYLAGKTVSRGWLKKFSRVPLLLVFMQLTLGVLALVNSPFVGAIGFSVAHQFVGMLLLVSLLVTVFLCGKRGVIALH
ncbi:COX15/CtaA family protein [Mucilaginibacter sp.]|uniref:COX15/CtaA family protein n=1 Tax=Mucilaginibacter sp. TaxID=1882438 RepID=UPI00283C11F8|nr:COX15/CtaA family protein [Mucilaginibacter sp.]MDR3695788.1 COX15/CtaA family protein [Mucilaginibacter sp.]